MKPTFLDRLLAPAMVIALAATLTVLPGCAARYRVVDGYDAEYAAAPAGIYGYPRYEFGDGYAYYVDGYWYHRHGAYWWRFRRGPWELERRRWYR